MYSVTVSFAFFYDYCHQEPMQRPGLVHGAILYGPHCEENYMTETLLQGPLMPLMSRGPGQLMALAHPLDSDRICEVSCI